MRSLTPNLKKRFSIAILVHDQASLSLILLLKEIFQIANSLLRDDPYLVELVGLDPSLSSEDIFIKMKKPKPSYDYFFIPPFQRGFDGNLERRAGEIELIRQQKRNGTCLTSACLGSLLLAAAGLLENREATTHWRWISFAKQRFPNVCWEVSRMICDENDLITVGGYLASIDLALYLIEKSSSKKTAQELGQVILADTIRQKQSVYAQWLVPEQDERSEFCGLERWLEKNLKETIKVKHLADQSKMSLRNFHRLFKKKYGISPNKFVQLKRIEKARELLRNQKLSIEQILDQVGVTDVTSFRKLFQREIGMSPAQFRKWIQ